ncbi:Rieske Fe-S protein [Friedmanniella luteola]|uniref:Cytochrome bc1 complex Rieske iron-sulfur subunit n=1 Tax=Friedmanniella luteola TaxID=546871 RepID=A0A1H1PII1_9ACTN|nr:Rieske (2Fe-2S) protein [Friedmanniella luteola]SDS10880.1 Rieske Fe-S protein [Friedmanniella luteola]
MPERDPNPFEHGTTRRTVLRAAGLAALAGGGIGVLGACSADGEVAAPAATSAAPSASAASSSAPSSAAPSASASSSAAAPAGASIATADVPVGSGVILKDAKYVVTQPTEGEFKAFSSICTHMGCPVAEVQGETIMCKCHGSQFSIKDGSVVKAPATKPLAEATATVSGDNVVVEA